MAKTAKVDVPAMYPLKGDHKKPEKSQIGIIEVKDKEEQGQGEIQIDISNQQTDNEIMAENDNVNIPVRDIRPIAQNVPRLNMGDLQVPPVLNEPIPMKPVKKATPVINYDQMLAPVNIDVTLKGQLPPFDMEKSFEAIHTVTSVAFESKDDPTQMTKIVIYNYILYYIQKTIHSKLICTNVHS